MRPRTEQCRNECAKITDAGDLVVSADRSGEAVVAAVDAKGQVIQQAVIAALQGRENTLHQADQAQVCVTAEVKQLEGAMTEILVTDPSIATSFPAPIRFA